MSQIETIMLIVLGFAVALLLVLIFGKLLWAPVVGLGKRRKRREDPVTMATLQADKDKLRAEAAMLSSKLELRLDDLKTRLAEQTAEVSRNRNRVDQLVGNIADKEAIIALRDKEVTNLKEQMIPLEKELVSRTQNAQQLKEQLRDRDDQIQNKIKLIDDLQQQLKSALAANAIVDQTDMSAKKRLEARISDLTDLSKQIANQRQQLTQQHSELKNLTGVITDSKSESGNKNLNKDAYLEQLDSGSSKLEKQLEEAERESEVLQKELAKLDEDWNDKLKQLENVKQPTVKPVKKAKVTVKKVRKKPIKSASKKSKSSPKSTTKSVTKKPRKTVKKNLKSDVDPEQQASNVVSLAGRIRSLQGNLKSL